MKILKVIILWSISFLIIVVPSCKNECDGVTCLNGGSCDDGTCECPDEYYGENCENMKIQNRLLTETPLELYNDNVPLDSIYGKMYEGGFIFYLNTNDGTGMVAATEDQSELAGWGCEYVDLSALHSVMERPPSIGLDTFIGARIGDGRLNAEMLLAICDETFIAVTFCTDLVLNDKDDWFLPSRAELNLMYTNLYQKGHGAFANDFYWSSTNYSKHQAWYSAFDDLEANEQNRTLKHEGYHVRAVREF